MDSLKQYITDLRNDNLVLQWFLERFELNLDEEIKLREKITGTNLPPSFLWSMVKVYDSPETFDARQFENNSLESILYYLKKTHQYYLDFKLVQVEGVINSWADGNENAISFCFYRFFVNYRQKLKDHIAQEEEILFPYIESLLKLNAGEKVDPEVLLRGKISLINFLLEHDHEIEDELTKFAEVLAKHENDLKDSMAYRSFLIQIQTFEKDLAIHARMEEEVLIPKAIRLESSVLDGLYLA